MFYTKYRKFSYHFFVNDFFVNDDSSGFSQRITNTLELSHLTSCHFFVLIVRIHLCSKYRKMLSKHRKIPCHFFVNLSEVSENTKNEYRCLLMRAGDARDERLHKDGLVS